MILLISFNFFNPAGVNSGPGISIWGLCSILERAGIEYKVFSHVYSMDRKVKSIKDITDDDIKRAKHIIYWSGLISDMYKVLDRIQKYKNFIVGPNLLDGVEKEKEAVFLKRFNPLKIMCTNTMIKYKILSTHNLNEEKIHTFMSPPDLSLWKKTDKEDFILWKGNPNHFVKNYNLAKDIVFNLKNERVLVCLNYNYLKHIELASKASLFFSTSMSETISMNLLEQWSCGTPAVITPGHFLRGDNYGCSIIAEGNTDDFVKKIREVFHNKVLLRHMSDYSYEWMQQNFSDKVVLDNFYRILEC